MKKRFVVAAMAALALAWAKPSAAETINFDVNGAGGAGTVVGLTAFDWLPGNSLLIENADGVTGRILYQANLNSIVTTTGNVANGTAGTYYTAVAAFDVVLVPGPVGSFTVVPGSGAFNIYTDAEGGNDLTGVGFAADAGSHAILSGAASFGGGNLQLFANTVQQLDQDLSAHVGPQFGGSQPAGDQYANVQTLFGVGGFNIVASVASYDQNYFLTAPLQLTVSSTTSTGSNTVPFNAVNPSALFSSNAVADANVAGANAVGPINGLCIGINPCQIIAQSDANTTLATVPEPASLTLLGLGLAGSAAARRRQKKAQQAA